MMRNIKKMVIALSAGAVALQLGGCSWAWQVFGDALGDTLAYNIFLD